MAITNPLETRVKIVLACLLPSLLLAGGISCSSSPSHDAKTHMGDSSANSAAIAAQSDHPTPSYETKIEIGGGTIDLMIMPNVSVSDDAIVDWTRRAATALTDFYGRYPVKQATIFISPTDSGKIENG